MCVYFVYMNIKKLADVRTCPIVQGVGHVAINTMHALYEVTLS